MFQSIKNIDDLKPKKPLLIQSQAGLTPNEEGEQCKIIAEHLKTQFLKNAYALPNPKFTWLSLILKQFANEYDLIREKACALVQDR